MAEATIAMPVRHEQFRIRGLRIHTQICGEGEPLLLYSGIWGQIGLWERLLPHLPGFQTIAFDPPGIGRSETPRYPQTMWALADFGSAVLDELGLESAHVLGASFGGAVAQQMAFSHPRRVRRLVLASTSFGGFAMPGNLQALWHFIHPNAYHPERLERVAGDIFGGRLRTEPELVRSMHIKRPTNTLAALYRMSALFGWTSLPWLWAIRQPTLVIAGDDDPITPLVNHRVIAMLMPQATLRVSEGWRAPGPAGQRRAGRTGDHQLPPGRLSTRGRRDRPAEPSAYALLTDGTTVEIRPPARTISMRCGTCTPTMSPENLYLRFFSMSRVAAEREAQRVCREPAPDRAALLAVLDGQVVGCSSYERRRQWLEVGGGRHGGRRRHA